MVSQKDALQTAKSALQAKNIPFKGIPAKQQLVTIPSGLKWYILFDLPMPLGMQDEYFTVVINAETGDSEGIITPTALL